MVIFLYFPYLRLSCRLVHRHLSWDRDECLPCSGGPGWRCYREHPSLCRHQPRCSRELPACCCPFLWNSCTSYLFCVFLSIFRRWGSIHHCDVFYRFCIQAAAGLGFVCSTRCPSVVGWGGQSIFFRTCCPIYLSQSCSERSPVPGE